MDSKTTNTSKNDKSPNKKNSQKKRPLSKHLKFTVLDHLKQHGCTHATLKSATDSTKRQELFDYMCNSSENAEKLINKECDSVSVNNINQWLEMLKTTGVSTLCEYEAALIMNGIVRNEPQPEPEQMGGVDLKEVYSFMENALLGQPQKKLSAKNAEFLSREFELLIDEANSDKSDEAAMQMGASLFVRQYKFDLEKAAPKRSIDPFVLDE